MSTLTRQLQLLRRLLPRAPKAAFACSAIMGAAGRFATVSSSDCASICVAPSCEALSFTGVVQKESNSLQSQPLAAFRVVFEEFSQAKCAGFLVMRLELLPCSPFDKWNWLGRFRGSAHSDSPFLQS